MTEPMTPAVPEVNSISGRNSRHPFGRPNRVTPLRQQYLNIKAEYPDCILFFRLGDFYETFDHDAEVAARELDLVLTGRAISQKERIPMAGVPYHAVELYIERLLAKGYHVAVCEQMSEPDGKGLVDRKVTRVLTPTTQAQAAEKPFTGALPKRQVEYLQAVLEGRPVVKNGATRKALREHHLITVEDDWTKQTLTESGRGWITPASGNGRAHFGYCGVR